jgi:type IV pilus assembly protein PilP
MNRRLHVAGAILAALVLGGCDGGRSELEQELTELARETRGRIEPLPQMSAYTPPSYQSRDLIEPFSPRRMLDASLVDRSASAVGAALHAAHRDRPRQALEAFPLEALRMVGTVELRGQTSALVRTDQSLFRVRVGDYMGQNLGQVTAIAADEISLKELVPDGNGGWVERIATMALQEEGLRK